MTVDSLSLHLCTEFVYLIGLSAVVKPKPYVKDHGIMVSACVKEPFMNTYWWVHCTVIKHSVSLSDIMMIAHDVITGSLESV